MWNDFFQYISDAITEFITSLTTQDTVYNGFMTFIHTSGPEGSTYTYVDLIYFLLMVTVVFIFILLIVKLFKGLLSLVTGGFSNV